MVVKHPGTLLSICKRAAVWKRSMWAACISRREGVRFPKPSMWTRRWRRIFRELDSLGVRLENRTTPTDPEEDLMKLL